MSKWQPIETAPRDGTRILVFDGKEINTVDYSEPYYIGINKHIEIEESWVQISDSGRATEFFPTHWMPLPEPPK